MNANMNRKLQIISIPLVTIFYSLGYSIYAMFDYYLKNWKIIFFVAYIIPLVVIIPSLYKINKIFELLEILKHQKS